MILFELVSFCIPLEVRVRLTAGLFDLDDLMEEHNSRSLYISGRRYLHPREEDRTLGKIDMILVLSIALVKLAMMVVWALVVRARSRAGAVPW